MDKVEISDTGVDQGLEGCQTDSLDDSSPQETLVVMAAGSSPCASDYDEYGAEDVEMPLTPDSCRCHEHDARYARAAEDVARQERDCCKVSLEPEGERDRVGGEERTEGRGDEGDEGEDAEHDVAFP